MSDIQVNAHKIAGFEDAIEDMTLEAIDISGNILDWIWNTTQDEKMSQADGVIGHVATTIDDEIDERYGPARRIIPPHNFLIRGAFWTDAATETVAAGLNSFIIEPIKEIYENYSTRHCLDIDNRAALGTQLLIESGVELLSAIPFTAIPVRALKTIRGLDKLDRTRNLVGKSHKEALISVFDNQLSSTEITDLMRGGNFDLIDNEETRQQIKEIVTDYLIQKNPDIPESEVIALVNEGAIFSDEVQDIFQEIGLLDASGNPINYVDEIANRKRDIEVEARERNSQTTTEAANQLDRINISDNVRNRLNELGGGTRSS